VKHSAVLKAELNWTDAVWRTDQWASRASLMVIGWRVRALSRVVPDATVMHFCLPISQFIKK